LVALMSLAIPSSASAQAAAASRQIEFYIPSRPLADALVDFSAATGLEVFYDGALAIGHLSTSISGKLTPTEALRRLLDGTGYVALAADDPDTFTILQATPTARPTAAADNAQLRPYEHYFATLQTSVSEALCHNEDQSRGQVIVSFWLASSGEILRAVVLDAGTDSTARDAIAENLRGLSVGKALPPGLPQPITMVIFPPTATDSKACRRSPRRAGN
jgi:hypothetical protein